MKKHLSKILALTFFTTSISLTSTFANNQTSTYDLVNKVENERLQFDLEDSNNLKINNLKENFLDLDKNFKFELPKEKIEFNPNSRISGAHSPSTAFYLPQNLLNTLLSDTIGTNQNWYYFDALDKTKLSLTLQMPQNSEYDLRLYKYNNGYLELVSFSEYYGTYEHLSYVAEPGTYYLGIIPFTPANNENFSFRVDTISNYDQNEADDNIWTAKNYTNKILTEQTIDNPFDEDFFKFSVTKQGKTIIKVSNITSEKYSVYLFDENLKTIGNFIANNKPRQVELPIGNYYIRVKSHDGTFNPNNKYNLQTAVLSGNEILTPKGDIVELYENKLYINGSIVPLTWDYEYISPGYPYYRTTQKLQRLDGDIEISSILDIGTFNGKAGAISDNAIKIGLKNFTMRYYHFKVGEGYVFDYEDFGKDICPIETIVDVNTGRIIDTYANMLYTDLYDFRSRFNTDLN